ncbi:phosphate signaling complex protein PhoU [Synechocystis sp. LKSZ1]|uniref:phosphate signaling complex protein PhoU n=1 Tax=Synechocystis sp. LKSZ1 TaxID=3144951 RepID=UPI00336BE0C1
MPLVSLSNQIHYPERSHFERALKRLEQDVLRMGALVEESFRLSHQTLFEQQLDYAPRIKNLDKQIDTYYRQIEHECSTLLTLQSPVAQDLRVLSAFMQLVRDLERIGDYAKDLAEISMKLMAYPPPSCLPQVAVMSRHAQNMLAISLVALTELDAQAGPRVKHLDDTVDQCYEILYYTLAHQQDIKGVVEPIILLALVIRHLERMADHATNIAQRVSYIVTGKRN